MSDLDADPPTQLTTHSATYTNHSIECCECGSTIPPKTKFHTTVGIWENQIDAFVTCLDCMELIKLLPNESDPERRCYGMLAYSIDNEFRSNAPTPVINFRERLKNATNN